MNDTDEGVPMRWNRTIDHEKTVSIAPQEIGNEILSVLRPEPSSLSITTLSGTWYTTYRFEPQGFGETVEPMLDQCGYQWPGS